MDTAPGGIFRNGDFVLRRVLLEILSVDRQLVIRAFFDFIESVGKGHIAVLVMMTEGFAVSSDGDKGLAGGRVGEGPHEH